MYGRNGARIARAAKALGGPMLALGIGFLSPSSTIAKTEHYRVLHSFDGSDGMFPDGTLAVDASGNVYGTAAGGGSTGDGVVFRMTPDGNVTVLHSFAGGGSDGAQPLGGLAIHRRTGALYGMTSAGGLSNLGIVFRISGDGKEKVLHTFSGAKDGESPITTPLRDRHGNLYGTTPYGGARGGGTIFRLGHDGTFKILYAFRKKTGDNPYSRLKMDKAGNLYGTTIGGGHGDFGVVFKLAPDQTYTVLHAFDPRSGDGQYPVGGLAKDAAGNLYGTTEEGGPVSGGGIVFKLAPDGTEMILHTFAGNKDGYRSDADLRHVRSGALYGTTVLGGKYNNGTVFRIAPDGDLTILHSFGATAGDGASPHTGLTRAPSGGFYGVTEGGGANGLGTIFWVDN